MLKKYKVLLSQLSSYLIVGGIAALTEWTSFFLTNEILLLNYLFSTGVSFVISTFVNWFVGTKLTFKVVHKSISSKKELCGVYFVSFIGLLINLILMYIFVNYIKICPLFGKILATGIAFFWNFFSRKFWIYKC